MLSALALCVSACASIGFISHSLRKAPEAWEDADGFHFGKQPAMVRRSRMSLATVKPQLFPIKRRESAFASAAYN
jgi:hypothetical protein